MIALPLADLTTLCASQDAEADVCIIGAGAAGIYLTRQLSRAGTRVVLLEAGPAYSVDAATAGFESQSEATPYSGATAGRFFGLGGTTAHWGGLLAPVTCFDVRPDEPDSWIWQHILDIVKSKSASVLEELGYTRGVDFETWPAAMYASAVHALEGSGIHVLASLHLPFRRKNLVNLLHASAAGRITPAVFTGAVATAWEGATGSSVYRARTLKAFSRNGNALRVTAHHFVIAAGALESARILLELNAACNGRALKQHSAPGCYLTDHVSLPIAQVPHASFKAAVALFAPRFSGAWMRNLRLIPTNPRTIPARAFAHFNFENNSRGFEVARKCLQGLQQRRLPKLSAGDVLAGAGELARLAEARIVRSRLHIPRGTPVQLQLDVEQMPVRENAIRLTGVRDKFGRQIPSIKWSVSNSDMANIEGLARHLLEIWPAGRGGVPPLMPCQLDASNGKLHDAYHPAGTTRMGSNPESVVDRDLKVWGTDNVYVASTGVLPSAGSANPTFSLLCLTHRLAETLAVRQ